MRVAGLLTLAFSLGAGCDRRPAPPPNTWNLPAPPIGSGTQPQSANASSASPSPDLAQRCVVPLPSQPPPIPQPAARCPLDPIFGGRTLALDYVSFPDALGAPSLHVELAKTPSQQERGLMYRTSMPEDRGMLFAFPSSSIHKFWMHNTCIPLDMMFIADDGFITGIVESAPTLDDGERSIACPVSYVLEVNAGWARRHGVAPGQRVKLPP